VLDTVGGWNEVDRKSKLSFAVFVCWLLVDKSNAFDVGRQAQRLKIPMCCTQINCCSTMEAPSRSGFIRRI